MRAFPEAKGIHLFLVAALICFLLLQVAYLKPKTVRAFDSRGPNIGISFGESIHEEITQSALKKLGFETNPIELIEDYNTDVDYNEAFDTKSYRPEHHFDRVPPETDKEAFKAGRDYIHEEKKRAIEHLKKCETKEAKAAIGRSLHALQDFFSHSNYVDLSAGNQKAKDEKAAKKAWEALFDPKGEPPDKLKLTGYDPKTKRPGKPRNDHYPHDKLNLDSPESTTNAKAKLPNGKTKHEQAVEDAIKATEEFVKKIEEDFKKEYNGETAGKKAEDLWEMLKKCQTCPPKKGAQLTPTFKELEKAVFASLSGKTGYLQEEELRGALLSASTLASGVSEDYPFGRNSEFALLELNKAISQVQLAQMRGDMDSAARTAKVGVGYARNLLDTAQLYNIPVGESSAKVAEAEELYNEGKYDGCLAIVSGIARDLLPRTFVDFQDMPPYCVYYVSAVHQETQRPLAGLRIKMDWAAKRYAAELTTDEYGQALLVGPPGSYRATVPINLKLINMPVLGYVPQVRDYMVLTVTAGSGVEYGVSKLSIVVSTLFLPLQVVTPLVENLLNIVLLAIVFVIVWTIGRIVMRKLRS